MQSPPAQRCSETEEHVAHEWMTVQHLDDLNVLKFWCIGKRKAKKGERYERRNTEKTK